MTLADLTIRRFMAALFNNDRDGIDNWDGLFTEYIDKSGQADAHLLGIMTNINNIQGRLAVIGNFIDFQQKFYLEFDEPFEPAFKDMLQYGHRVKWNPADPEGFLTQLKFMESKEKRNVAELDLMIKELNDIQKGAPIIKEDHNSRESFVRMLNIIGGKPGGIDRDKTDMEEFCVALKDYFTDLQNKINKANDGR